MNNELYGFWYIFGYGLLSMEFESILPQTSCFWSVPHLEEPKQSMF
jgi:hypothetical protein